MKYVRYAVIAFAVVLTGCASTGGNSTSRSPVKGQQKDIWERLRKGFDMPDLQDSRVEYWTNYYAARPKSVQIMAERSAPYIYHIAKELEKRNMPRELALLPFVESAYNAKAFSRSKAAGLWQFIPSTGTHYNLTQDWWQDERRDPISSTRAALDYLSYLYRFQDNDWHLALASYNWGEGAVKRARNRNAAVGLGTDYLSLRMPAETRDYVPKLQAIENIVRNPAKYGIVLPSIPDQPYFEEVVKTEDMDVSLIVKLANISMEEFQTLNPAPNRQVLLAQHRPRVLLPKNKVAQYKKNLKEFKGEKSQWSGYTPTMGESMLSIAQRYGISLDRLKSMNGYGRSQNVALSSRALLVPRLGLSRDANPSGIDTRDIQNSVATSSTMLASNQVNMPVQASPISQVNPNVRLGQSASAAVAQARLAANTATPVNSARSSAALASSVSAPGVTVVSNSVSNEDILQQMITSHQLDRVGTGVTAKAPSAGSVMVAATPMATPSPTAIPASARSYQVSAQAPNNDMIASLVANPRANMPAAPQSVAVSRHSAGQTAARQADYHPAQNSASARPAVAANPAPTKTAKSTATRSTRPAVHTVKTGETLYSLAKRYNTTVESVQALNNLGSRTLKVGDRLRMPGSGAQS